MDKPNTYSCNCPEGKTLAKDGFTCGGTFHPYSPHCLVIPYNSLAIVCPYNGFEYLIGDRVKIGCNWW